jgi:hypothetical protein
MKGADAPGLRSQVDFLIYEAFPREFRPISLPTAIDPDAY